MDDKDYRRRYQLPEHWVAHEAGHLGIDYFAYVSLVLDLLPPEPRTILDAGCGDGRLAAELVRRGHRVVGVDYSERAVGFARVLVPGPDFLCADLSELDRHPELDREFQTVLLVEVLEHLPPAAHAKLLRALALRAVRGGELIVTVPTKNLPLNKWHYVHFSYEEIEGLLRGAGWAVERVVYNYRVNLWSRLLYSRSLPWRLIQNRHYDLIFARRALRGLFERWFKVAPSAEKAGRYILLCRRQW